jgi:hypothetical protein
MPTLMLVLFAALVGGGVGFVVGRVWEIRQAMRLVSRYSTQLAPASHAHQSANADDLLARNDSPMGF